MPVTEAASPRRQRTRQRLIDAATEVVARHGFHRATVDAIARHAGYSIGALYANFGGKDELFFAVFDGHLEWFEERLKAGEGDDPGDAAADWLALLAREPDQFLVFVEFWAYAVRKPELRREFARRMRRMRRAVEAAIERRAAEGEPDTALDAPLAALLMLALGRGLALERLADPRAVPDARVRPLLAAFVP